MSAGVDYAEGWNFGDEVEEERHLLRVGPDLPDRYALDAAAEEAEMRVGNAEDAAGSAAEGADYEVAVIGLYQENFGYGGMGEMDAAHGRHLAGDADGVIQGEHYYFSWRGGDGMEDRGDVDWAGGDFELGTAAQGAGKELRLHAVGIGNQDSDRGWGRRHELESSEWSGFESRLDLRDESGGTQGNMSHYSREAFKSGKRDVVLWKNRDGSDWDGESCVCLCEQGCGARVCCLAVSWVSLGGCDFVNMQVYFCG